jgi:IS5 family transposase
MPASSAHMAPPGMFMQGEAASSLFDGFIWPSEHERSYFGYKNHIGVDRRHKFVRRYVMSDASVHDSQKFEDVLDTSNTASDVWADSAYRGGLSQSQTQ